MCHFSDSLLIPHHSHAVAQVCEIGRSTQYNVKSLFIYIILYFCIFFVSANPQRQPAVAMQTLLAYQPGTGMLLQVEGCRIQTWDCRFTARCATVEPPHPLKIVKNLFLHSLLTPFTLDFLGRLSTMSYLTESRVSLDKPSSRDFVKQ